MQISFQNARRTSLGIMIVLIVSVCIIPLFLYSHIAGHLQSFLISLSNVDKSMEIMNLFHNAREDFDGMVNCRCNQVEPVNDKMNKIITISNSIIEKNLNNTRLQEKASLFIKSTTKFRNVVQYYAEEIEVDPNCDNADQMEKLAIETKNESMEILASFVRDCNEDVRFYISLISDELNIGELLSVIALSMGIFLGLIAAILMTKALAIPLEKLIQGTRKIAEGDLNHRVQINTKDEIGHLSHSFNNMAQKLLLAGEQLRSIVDSMPFMLLCVNSKGEISLMNKVAHKKTGYSNADAINKKLWEIIPYFKPEKENVLATINKGKLSINRRYNVISEGRNLYFDITLYPYRTSMDKGAVVLIQNVSRSVHMEEMMIQSEKMMSVGGLAAGMAHEINNPLGIIMGLTQTIIRRFSLDLKKNKIVADAIDLDLNKVEGYMRERDIIKSLDGIMDAGNRAAKIVRDMLEFSRKSESVRAKCSLHNLLDKAVELASNDYDLKKKFDFRAIHIKKRYQEDLPLINVIETEIEQVFLNLLRNAAQAMADKDYTEEERPTIALQTMKKGNLVQVKIEDNGPGMDKTTCKRIFEPFFTTKDVGKGTGLGLSVSYFIITNTHKGDIFVESTPDIGTKFIIHLPIDGVPE